MRNKAKSSSRIALFQKSLHKLAKLRAARVELEAAALAAQRNSLLEALDPDGASYAILLQAAARRMGDIALLQRALDGQRDDAAREAIRTGRLAKIAERAASRAQSEERVSKERRALEEIMECAAGNPDASPA